MKWLLFSLILLPQVLLGKAPEFVTKEQHTVVCGYTYKNDNEPSKFVERLFVEHVIDYRYEKEGDSQYIIFTYVNEIAGRYKLQKDDFCVAK